MPQLLLIKIHCAPGVPVILAFPEGVAFVAFGFAFAETEFNFYKSFVQIKLQRYQGQAFFPDLLEQLQDFPFMEEQGAFADGVMVKLVAFFISRDMDIEQHCLAVLDTDVGVHQGYITGAAAFDFSAGQAYSGFVSFQDGEVMKSLFVACQNIAVIRFFSFFTHFAIL
jgi:hypothetical protein